MSLLGSLTAAGSSELTDLHIEAGNLPVHSPLGLRLLLQLLHQAVPVLLKLTQTSGKMQLLTSLLRQQLLVEKDEGTRRCEENQSFYLLSKISQALLHGLVFHSFESCIL